MSDGTASDFQRAVNAEPGETVAMFTDMPLDGKRTILDGFTPILDERG